MAAVHRSLLLRDIGVRDHLRSAAGHALAFAVELHRAPADGEVSGRLELLDERRRSRSRPQLSAFRYWLVRMREDRDLSGQSPSLTHTIRHT